MLGARSLWLALALGTVGGATAAAGCVLEPPPTGKPGPCGGRACSQYGYCERGSNLCRCDAGYAGNPYAAYGCQAVAPGGDCGTTCGLNAYCDGDAEACTCTDGFVAVCGTGDCLAESSLCDGVADCANAADEQDDVCYETVIMEWVVTDACRDGGSTQWRVWASEREWVWPGPDDSFVTRGLDAPSAESVECLVGELLCFGATAGDIDWGVGASGSVACEDCCETCQAGSVDYGALACD